MKESYFILPYIIYAEHWYTHNDFTQSVRFLVNGANDIPAKAINFPDLNPHLAFPVKDFYSRLYYSHHTELASQLKELGKIYLPKEPIFA